MKTMTPQKPCLTLTTATAADLMSPNPVSLRADATVREAIALFVERGFGAAPVIDHAGRPVGVVSRTDVLLHEREQVRHAWRRTRRAWTSSPPGLAAKGSRWRWSTGRPFATS